jgi:hypothetical protein
VSNIAGSIRTGLKRLGTAGAIGFSVILRGGLNQFPLGHG